MILDETTEAQGAPTVVKNSNLTLSASTSRDLRLLLPAGQSWQDSGVTRFDLRSASGARSLEVVPDSRTLELPTPASGCALVTLDFGAQASTPTRPTQCSKVVRCAGGTSDRTRRRHGALFTEKTGARAELRPLFNPASLQVGADLAVRLYHEGAVVATDLVATSPSGEVISSRADEQGIAVVPLGEAGWWQLEFTRVGTTAQLLFEVLER